MASYYSHENIDHPVKGRHTSAEIRVGDLDLFSEIGINHEIESSYYEPTFANKGGLDTTQNEVIYEVKPSVDLISLVDSYVEAVLSIQKKDGTDSKDPPSEEKVFASNNCLGNLWRDMRISLNGTEIQAGNGLYYVENYIMLLLSLSSEALPKYQSAGYYSDLMVSQADPTVTGGDKMILKRYNATKDGAKYKLRAPLFSSGVTQCSRALPSLSRLQIRYYKAPGGVAVTKGSAGAGEYFVKIEEFIIHLKRCVYTKK